MAGHTKRFFGSEKDLLAVVLEAFPSLPLCYLLGASAETNETKPSSWAHNSNFEVHHQKVFVDCR